MKHLDRRRIHVGEVPSRTALKANGDRFHPHFDIVLPLNHGLALFGNPVIVTAPRA